MSGASDRTGPAGRVTSQRIEFQAGGVRLVGDLHRPAEGAERELGAVVLHPHPAHGGDRRNLVVFRLARALAAAGHVTLRFDFRGAGDSEGRHGGGEAEVADAEAAVAALRQQAPGVQRVALAGYSFGAYVAGLGGASLGCEALVAVAPPVAVLDCSSLARFPGAQLLIVGDQDPFAPLGRVEELAAEAGAALRVLPDTDHFLQGREAEVASHAVEFLGGR